MENTLPKRPILSLLLAIFGAAYGIAQQTGPDWTAGTAGLRINGHYVTVDSQLGVQGDTFTWEQSANGAAETTEFAIQSVGGNWDASTSIGDMSYGLLYDGTTGGTLRVEGAEGGVTLTLTVPDPNGAQVQYVFVAETLTYL